MNTTITAEEAARRLRIWRVTHRAMATVAELERETQIPAKRLQKLLLQRDSLSEYRDHILKFLEAFERKDEPALVQLRGNGSATLPAAHTCIIYEPDVLSALKDRQKGMTRRLERPHCLIVNQEISPRKCVATQKSRDCYGCAASTRFCAECGFDFIAFPGAELCNFCLTKAWEDPEIDKIDDSGVIHVECHIAGGKRITTVACQRMQGDACGSCNAITRRVRYPDFGLCLKCHVELFNPSWIPLDEDERDQQQRERDAFLLSVTAPPEIPTPEVVQEETPPEVVESSPTTTVLQGTLALMYALSQVWAEIQLHHPEVPEAVVLPAPATSRNKKRLGSFSTFRWQHREKSIDPIHEVLVVAEKLNQTVPQIVAELLHEAAHAMNYVRGVKDHSQSSQYHNQHFKEAAEEVGLSVECVQHYGHAETSLSEGTAARYAAVMASLRQVMLHRVRSTTTGMQGGNQQEGPIGRSLKAVCSCRIPYVIRVSRKTMQDAVIRCDKCGQLFKLA